MSRVNEELNGDTQLYFGPLQYFGRCRGCNNNLTANNPASQYQRQKIIQNQVRVMSSLYTMNIKALNSYQKPNTLPETIALNELNYVISPGVNWNQMSDRRIPHIQKVKSASGTNPGGNSVKSTITRLRPGALSPGGVGVDIKHNSYDRYLNRIKGKAPLRRGIIPSNYGREVIPFNPAFPIYGGKVFKTNLVNGCNCPEIEKNNSPNEELLYTGDTQKDIYDVKYNFSINDRVIIIARGPYLRRMGRIIDIIDIEKGSIMVELDTDSRGSSSRSDTKIFFSYQIVIDVLPRCPINTCSNINILNKEYEAEKLIANRILKALTNED
jgi:hypothetical protein